MYFVKMAMVIVSVFEVTDIKEEGMESSLTLWLYVYMYSIYMHLFVGVSKMGRISE